MTPKRGYPRSPGAGRLSTVADGRSGMVWGPVDTRCPINLQDLADRSRQQRTSYLPAGPDIYGCERPDR